MADFFENLEYDEAMELQQLSRLIYELRENRNAALKSYGAEDEAALLQKIESGAVDEHPAYEHYLAARILADIRATVRARVSAISLRANRK